MKRPPPTIAQLGEIATKALRNSLQLLAEAEGLASFERFARATTLCVLAGEEFGKHLMCFGALGRGADDDEFWKDFWKRFTDHKPKYENVVQFVTQYVEDEEARKAFLAEFHQHVISDLGRKMAGLYVDVKDGKVIAPDEATDPESLHHMLYVFGVAIRLWAEHWDGYDFPAGFAAAEADAAKMQTALKSGDPDVIKQAWEETT